MNKEEYNKLPLIQIIEKNGNIFGDVKTYRLIDFYGLEDGIGFNTAEGEEFHIPFEEIINIFGMTIYRLNKNLQPRKDFHRGKY